MITPSPQRVFLSEVAVVLIIIGLFLWALVMLKGRVSWAEAIGPVTYLLHVLLFYSVWLAGKPGPNEFFSLWSVTLRLHAIIWFVSLPLALQYRRRAG